MVQSKSPILGWGSPWEAWPGVWKSDHPEEENKTGPKKKKTNERGDSKYVV